MCFPQAWARLLPSAVSVWIKSRSTSASPPNTASIKRQVLIPVSAHGSAKDRNGTLASTIRLTMVRRSKGRAPAGPRHRYRIAGASLPSKRLSSRWSGPRTLLAVNVPAVAFCGAELFKLAFEGLPLGADAGVPDKPFLRMRFDHTYDAYEPLKSWAHDHCQNS
jgi:hypothetical protein